MARKKRRTKQTELRVIDPGTLLAVEDSSKFLDELGGAVSSQGASDYESMSDLGRLIVDVLEFAGALEFEGVLHYLLYSDGRWRNIGTVLREIGAKRSADALEEVLGCFPNGELAKGAVERAAQIDSVENSCEAVEVFQALVGADVEDFGLLLRDYLVRNIEGFRDLLSARRSRIADRLSMISMNDEELVRRAYISVDAFDGIESILLREERLGLLLRIAEDEICPTREKILRVMYAIVGSVASELLSGKKPSHMDDVLAVVRDAATSVKEDIRIWAARSVELISSPRSDVIIDWMGAVLLR